MQYHRHLDAQPFPPSSHSIAYADTEVFGDYLRLLRPSPLLGELHSLTEALITLQGRFLTLYCCNRDCVCFLGTQALTILAKLTELGDPHMLPLWDAHAVEAALDLLEVRELPEYDCLRACIILEAAAALGPEARYKTFLISLSTLCLICELLVCIPG